MRLQKRKDWPNILPQAIDNWNKSRHESLGHLRPIDLKSPEDAVKVDYAIGYSKESKFLDHEKNMETFTSNNKYELGTFVYVPVESSTRGFHQQVFICI